MTEIKNKSDFLKLHLKDNVAVALHAITKETQLTFEGRSYSFTEEIPQGHKIALIDLNKGDHVIKYGYPIGHLLSDVKAGQWLHTHNVKTNLSGTLAYTYEPNLQPVVYPKSQLTFKGYRRKNAKSGFVMICMSYPQWAVSMESLRSSSKISNKVIPT